MDAAQELQRVKTSLRSLYDEIAKNAEDRRKLVDDFRGCSKDEEKRLLLWETTVFDDRSRLLKREDELLAEKKKLEEQLELPPKKKRLKRATGASQDAEDGPSGGPGVRVPTPEAKAREKVIARYAVTDTTGKRAFTPMLKHIVVTYYHGSHAKLQVGQEIEVLVNDGARDKQRLVKGRVIGVHEGQHVLFGSTTEPIDAPNLDVSVRAGEPYIMLGCSNRSQQGEPFSLSHGNISTTTPDINGFIRGDTAALPGQSGGGCFSAETGKLIAINVAADAKNGNRAVLLPVAALMTLLQQHHTEVQKLMPDFMHVGGEFIFGDEKSS